MTGYTLVRGDYPPNNGIDLGNAPVFPSLRKAAMWVVTHKLGLAKATRARRLESTYRKAWRGK